MENLSVLPAIKVIKLSSCDGINGNTSVLAPLKKLVELSIINCYEIVVDIEPLISLETISIRAFNIHSLNASSLKKLKRLVVFINGSIRNGSLETLPYSLVKLEVRSYGEAFGGHLSTLHRFPSLQELTLVGTLVSGKFCDISALPTQENRNRIRRNGFFFCPRLSRGQSRIFIKDYRSQHSKSYTPRQR
jgi:hypothetical protein